MSKKEGCLLCDFDRLRYLEIPGGRIEPVNRCVYRNAKAMCIIDRDYLTRGHVIVIVDQETIDGHPGDFDDIESEEASELMKTVHKCYGILKRSAQEIERVYVACLNESGHVHFHLIPRRKGDCTGFQFLGDREKQRCGWDKLTVDEKRNRANRIREMVEEIGRHCNECPSQNCRDKSVQN